MSSDELLEPDGLDNLTTRSIEDVRAQRAACLEVETGLSYLRRLVQGSLDIAGREIAHRAGDDAGPRSDALVDELPDILGDNPRPAGVGRLSATLAPTQVDAELQAEYQSLVDDGRLAHVAELDDDALAALDGRLRSLEAQISAKRHRYHERIDALQAELTRRYQSGEASVDTLLRDAT